MRQLFTRLALFALLMVSALNVWAANSAQAQALIKDTTNKVLEVLKADSSQIYTLVDEVVLPHFDFVRMSRLVLGKNWRRATRTQKSRFVKEFRDLLVRTYATALVDAAGKVDKIDYSNNNIDYRRATVRTKVYQKGNPSPIDVVYAMYYHKGKWQVYNVSVGGVSLVTNYRTEFANDFRIMGMDGLISKIKNQNRDNS